MDERRSRRPRAAKKQVRAARKERGMIMRLLLRSPSDTLAAAVVSAAVLAIIINAMFLQTGRHPAPMFDANVVMFPLPSAKAAATRTMPAPTARAVAPEATTPQTTSPAINPVPRPRPLSADQRSEIAPVDPIGQLVRTVSTRTTTPARETASEATVPAVRVVAVQRALTDYGYGQLKPTGRIGPDTVAAIKRFEEERGLPLSGQISRRMTQELSALTGERID